MGAKSTKLPFENTYKEWTPTNTPDINAVRNMPDESETLAPNLQAQYDRSTEINANRMNSAYNQNIPNAARLAMQAENDRNARYDYGANLAQASDDSQTRNYNRRLALAGLTIGKPLQTGGYTHQKGGWLNSLMEGAGAAATSFA